MGVSLSSKKQQAVPSRIQSSTCSAISGSENHPHTPKLKLCNPHRTDAGRTELRSVGTLPRCCPARAWTRRCQHRSSSFLPATRGFTQSRSLSVWWGSKDGCKLSRCDLKKTAKGKERPFLQFFPNQEMSWVQLHAVTQLKQTQGTRRLGTA